METKMKNESKEIVTFEELTLSNMYEIQAVIRVLVRKGILKEDEVLEEIRLLREEHVEKRKQIGQA